MISKILRKNTSPGRIVGFVISNLIGLAIVLGGLQFYLDASSFWTSDDSFVRSDYLVLNKKVTSSNTLGQASTGFSEAEIADLQSQPWVRRIGRFQANDFRVTASVSRGGAGMSTYMFFESIPDEFVDVPRSQWLYRPGSGQVPIILSKDYLTLYNFGFAGSQGLPQLSEGLMSSIPLQITLRSEDGTRTRQLVGHVAGFSNRLNTILVPQAFMQEANEALGSHGSQSEANVPKRLIVDVNSPGDVAITRYLEEHDLEVGGDKTASSAAFLLKVVVGIVLAVGVLITILSLSILILSVSLIMEKNRDKLHQLLMLGYPVRQIEKPYASLVIVAAAIAFAAALGLVFILRAYYMKPLEGFGAHASNILPMLGTGVGLTLLIILFNLVFIRRRVVSAFRN